MEKGNSNSEMWNRYSSAARGMMAAWEFKEGSELGLGVDNQGMKEPIKAASKRKKHLGLGYPDHGSKKSEEKDRSCYTKWVKFVKPEAEAVSSPQEPVLKQQKPKPRKRVPAVSYDIIITPKKKVVPEAEEAQGVVLVPYSSSDDEDGDASFQYKDLLQHASGVGNSNSEKRSAKEKASHLALVKYLQEDLADSASEAEPSSERMKTGNPIEDCDQDEKLVYPWKGIVELKIQLELEKKKLEMKGYELAKREAHNETERKKLAEDLEENASKNSSLELATMEQQKADEEVKNLAEYQRRQKEELHETRKAKRSETSDRARDRAVERRAKCEEAAHGIRRRRW